MKSNLANIILAILAIIICAAEAADSISRKLTPPKEDDNEDLWNEHPITSTENAKKVTQDSYLPIYETENETPKSRSTTVKSTFPKKAGGSDDTKLKTIPESEDELESFESAAQSYYPGYGYGGGRWNGGNRPGYGRPARPYYGNYYGRPWGGRGNTIWVG